MCVCVCGGGGGGGGGGGYVRGEREGRRLFSIKHDNELIFSSL